ncbi:MAG: Lrp/AsnC family transcriptional regulator [archaeon]|jgi:Lrp/AsnC family leucine-responsive transcriptional regulator
MSVLDNKDSQILLELDQNARMSASKIAKRLKLSQDIVNYRIKNLEERGIIKGYISVVQFFRLGYSIFKIYFQFQHLPKAKHDEIISFFSVRKEVTWVAESNGRWDLMVTFVVEDLMDFENAKNEFLAKYSDFVSNKSISVMTQYRTSPRNYLVQTKHSSSKPLKVSFEKFSGTEFDELDLKLVKIISTDARISIIDLSKKLNISPRVANYRLTRLGERGIILGSRVSLNLEKIGYKFFKAFIYLENATEKRRHDLLNYCDEHPNIIHSVVNLGDWDFEAEFEVQSNEQFYEILSFMRGNFSDIIKTVESVLISKEYELHYF